MEVTGHTQKRTQIGGHVHMTLHNVNGDPHLYNTMSGPYKLNSTITNTGPSPTLNFSTAFITSGSDILQFNLNHVDSITSLTNQRGSMNKKG